MVSASSTGVASARAAMPSPVRKAELRAALRSCTSALLGVGLFSCVSNILMLTGSLLCSRFMTASCQASVPTLVALSLLVAGLLIAQAILELIRSRMLTRVGATLEERVGDRVFDAILRTPLVARDPQRRTPRHARSRHRAFVPRPRAHRSLRHTLAPVLPHRDCGLASSPGPCRTRRRCAALRAYGFDRGHDKPFSEGRQRAFECPARLGEAGRRNADVVHALGMGPHLRQRWGDVTCRHATTQLWVSDTIGGFGAVAKMLRMMLQSGILALGAYLAIHGDATAGSIVAAGILTSRALAPVELAIGNWRTSSPRGRDGSDSRRFSSCFLPRRSRCRSPPRPRP